MDINKSEARSNLKISSEVIAKIAGIAATETNGVSGLSQKNLNIKDVIGATSLNSPFKIQLNDDVCKITINIILKNGFKIKEICEKVQSNIKESVQSMTGITVSKVNVCVSGVDLELPQKA
jgi:uncharacterized alkaline shock family protein YloU